MENKMMVMRRALRDVSRVAEEMTRGTMTGESVDRKTVDAWAMRLCGIISRDLDTPLRNCEVGTLEEQCERLINRCSQFNMSSDMHKLVRKLGAAILEWAQMPYEEGGADGNK